MRLNRKKHLLLKKLVEKYSRLKEEKGNLSGSDAGMFYSEIRRLLNINEHQRKLLFAELYNLKEVIEFKEGEKYGCFINSSVGLDSYASKKYIVRNRQLLKSWAIDAIQMVIPILSLLITIFVIIRDDSKREKEIELLENKIKQIENKVDIKSSFYPSASPEEHLTTTNG